MYVCMYSLFIQNTYIKYKTTRYVLPAGNAICIGLHNNNNNISNNIIIICSTIYMT